MVKEFSVGDRVRVTALPSYVKTAEPMPMLRPPSVLRLGEEGVILSRHPGDSWAIRLEKGAFLLGEQYFEPIDPQESPALTDEAIQADQADAFGEAGESV